MSKFIAVLCVTLCFPAFAGTANGKVTLLMVHSQGGNEHGVIMFQVENKDSPPACATSAQWAVSLESKAGEAMYYALLLSAEARDASVFVEGYDDCEAWVGRERPKFVRFIN